MRKLVMQVRWSCSGTLWKVFRRHDCQGGDHPFLARKRVGVLPFLRQQARCHVHAHHESTESKLNDGDGWKQILDRPWFLPSAATKTTKVVCRQGAWRISEIQGEDCSFHVIRDDLLHPIIGGNKLRKLDAVVPLFQAHGVTDVVTCGGCQSAHSAAVAVACAEVGMKAHLLLRGEKPATPTGYNLVSGMYGYVTYIPRSEYADRQAMLQKYAIQVAGHNSTSVVSLLHDRATTDDVIAGRRLTGSMILKEFKSRVAILNEGAGECHSLLGLIRLVNYLSQPSQFGKDETLRIVVDCGTGTTAVGVALGIVLNGLPWHVVGVMLADTQEGYEKHATRLVSEFSKQICAQIRGVDLLLRADSLPIIWQNRRQPRRFGRVLPGEIQTCRKLARETGILLDPIYTLAGWEAADDLCHSNVGDGGPVALLHTGGTLGLFGLAQRYPLQF